MRIITNPQEIPRLPSPIALSIGVYDGVHAGHQELIKQLHVQTRTKGTRVVLTFSNHPSQILEPERARLPITPLKHKLHLLQQFGIDVALILPFTHTLAQTPYADFLHSLHAHLPFDLLTLGEGATIGKGGEGKRVEITALGEEMGFQATYIKRMLLQKQPISSRRIRQCIGRGDLQAIRKLLKRPYSIRTSFTPSDIVRQGDASFRWTFTSHDLCPLPTATYSIDIEGEEKIPAIGLLESFQADVGTSRLLLSLSFQEMPSPISHLNLAFTAYLHPQLTPGVPKSAPLPQRYPPQPLFA